MNRVEFLIESARFEVWCFDVLGVRMICFTFWRSPEAQLIEFNAGRSHVKSGKHQIWQAKDYALFDDLDNDWICDQNEIRWKNDPRYEAMGIEWEKRGGIWGGRFKSLSDIYHFEG